MSKFRAILMRALPFLFMIYAHPVMAQNEAAVQNKLKSYFNAVAVKVKNTEAPAQKREIFYRAPRFGRKNVQPQHSGWACWQSKPEKAFSQNPIEL